MKDITNANFGLLIAYVIPGFVLLWGIEPFSLSLQTWLGKPVAESTTVAGFLYVTVASVGLGLFASTLRWLVIDRIHHRTGIPLPRISLKRLSRSTDAFDRLVEHHYRYYQHSGNTLIAVWLAIPMRWMSAGFQAAEFLAILIITVALWLGSRDSLRKYRAGLEDILNAD